MLKFKRMALLWLMAAAVFGVAAQQPMPSRVRVKLQREVSHKLSSQAAALIQPASADATLRTGVESLDKSMRQIKGVTMRQVFPCPPGREAEHKKYGLDQWWEVTFDELINPFEARQVLKTTAGVETANVRVPLVLFDDGPYHKLTAVEAKASSSVPFNDPSLSKQWHYNNNGSMSGAVAGADINLFKAWEIETGSKDVVVAIVDGGIEYDHDDLKNAMWHNTKELNGTAGVDDDGNGFIDDVYGYNFCTMSGTVYAHNHGTHVAGTVGAVNNNNTGVGGVAGGNDGTGGVRLMSAQVFDSRSGTGQGDFAAALVYAADMGATIAQCSWGWEDPDYYEQDVLDAIKYFTETSRSNNMTGGLCIFAAGNVGATGNFYPACVEEVVAVGSMTYDLRKAPYSNYGSWVDVTAPGGLMDFDAAQGVLSTLPGNSYGYSEGTSMACPHVSGIAALILSKYGSSTLINESVRQQLITAVSDFYSSNPSDEGTMGSGYIDAYKALQWGDGTAPEAVTDLVALPSQESVQLTWTIPNASAGAVNSHVIYYSKSPIAEATLSDCQSRVVDTKFYLCGEKVTEEISGLDALTTYYFAIKAVDRWGNASALSSVIEATTNAGPKMAINRTSFALSTSDGVTWGTRNITISNKDEGLLKWKAVLRTASSHISPYSVGSRLMTVPYEGKLAAQQATSNATAVPDEAVEAFMQEDFPKQISYFSSVYAFLGDTDQTCKNSMAQLFSVDAETYPDGFNLTHINLQGYYGKTPVIEIYRNAGTLSSSTLLESVQTSGAAYYFDHELTESLYFAPGESFYIVVHFTDYDSRNYPLGMALSNGASTASQAFISADGGATWSLLSEALRGSTYEEQADKATWAITAKSKYPDWSRMLKLTPAEGQLAGGTNETQIMAVTSNGTRIPNGEYKTKIRFETNEAEPNELVITGSITVEGQAPDITYNKIVQFGNVLVGQSKSITIQVVNKGYGAFAGGTSSAGLYTGHISSTSEHFSGPEYISSGFPARAISTITLTYAPQSAGSHSGQVIFTDHDGRQLKINVQGAATEPAKMVVTPSEIEVGELDASGETHDVAFTIENQGQYPLQYVMPKFSDEQLDEVAAGTTHTFGYNFISNLYGSDAVAYEGEPNLLSPVDVSSQFGDYNYFSQPVDIGFEFPFYGKTYEKVYISSMGMLTFDTYTAGTMYSPLTESKEVYLAGLGCISAYGFQFTINPEISRVEYSRQDGKFVVNFKNVMVVVYGDESRPASFHIVLSPNGDIDIAFDDYDPTLVFQEGKNLWVGIVDPDMADPLTVTSAEQTSDSYFNGDTAEEGNRWRYIKSGTQFHFTAPQPDMIRTVAPASAILAPGEKVDVTATVGATDEMYAGDITTYLVVHSNDIQSPTTIITFKGSVVGDLNPVFDISAESIEFGEVMRTSVVRQAVTVHNHGRAPMTLTDVALRDGNVTHDFSGEDVTIDAGRSKDIVITLPTEVEGEVSDLLTITTSEGEKQVTISGKVIGVPVATLSYSSLNVTIPSGEKKKEPLTVTNDGNEPLEVALVPGNFISYNAAYEEGSRTNYSWASSVDDPSQAREWVDIETNGLGTQYTYTYFMLHDILELDLPFDFPYYGKTYNHVQVFDSGFLTFNSYTDEGGVWPEPPASFPAGTTYKNVIAPYWGLHTMDITTTAGIFLYTDNDKAVVSFIEYGNTMNAGVCFQVILRKDGSFTFNYKPAYENAIQFGSFGVAGCSDENGKGIALADRYFTLGTSCNFTPVVTSTLAPGEKLEADIEVVADELAGKYNSNLKVVTNVPTTPSIDIPLSLTITGEPDLVFPEDVTVEHTAEYIDTNYDDELIGSYGVLWYVPLEISNNGTAPFTITNIKVNGPTFNGQQMFSLYYYGTFINSWTEQEDFGWSPYAGSKIEIGRTPLKMAVPLTQSDFSAEAWATPGTYDIAITFMLSGISGVTQKTVNVKIIITEQPTIALDREEVRVTATTNDYVGEHSFGISNAEGKYKLTYSLSIDHTGVGAEDSTDSGVATFSKISADKTQIAVADDELIEAVLVDDKGRDIKPSDVYDSGEGVPVYDLPTEGSIEYRRSMYWPALATSTTMWNYGSTTKYETYRAATMYKGPEGGFNISHVYIAMHPYNLSNTDVVVEIYNCHPQMGDDILGKGTLHLGDVTSKLYENITTLIALDSPVYISEGQTFWVVVNYPAGQEYPASLIMKQDGFVSGRYLGYTDSYGWFDVAALFYDNYGSLGYVTTLIETNEGSSWIKLLDAEGNAVNTLEGEVAAGEIANVKLQISAATAPKETGNMAMVVVRSNDPKTPAINLPVYLDKNSTPVIRVNIDNVSVDEGATAEVVFEVTDADGDDVTLELFDNGSAASLTSETKTDGVTTAVVTIAPEFGTDGSYSFTLSATDTNNHEAQATVNYTINHVNRAPISLGYNDFGLAKGTSSEPIDLSVMFEDPDGDKLTYKISTGAFSSVQYYMSGSKVIFYATGSNRTKVNVTATDPSGLSAVTSFYIDCSISGIDNVTIDEFSMSPNPVQDMLYISVGEATGEAVLTIHSINGVLMMNQSFRIVVGTPTAINVGMLPPGGYVATVTLADGRSSNMLLIKQ